MPLVSAVSPCEATARHASTIRVTFGAVFVYSAPKVAILARPEGRALPWMTRVYHRKGSAVGGVSHIMEGHAFLEAYAKAL